MYKMAFPPSPTRRVLGDKTTNASIVSRPTKDQRMLDLPAKTSPSVTVNKTTMKVTPRAGQKRRIHEVDGAEEQNQNQGQAGSSSPLTDVATDPRSETEQRSFSSASQPKTATLSLLSSFHVSQEPPAPLEDQFEIQDEMSQQTLDKIHATPLPQNTTQLQPPLRPSLTAENSQDSVRMSSFIDFEENEPEEDNMKMISSKPSMPEGGRSKNPDVDEKAETLRTRLQLALYKVQTNQISRPFSRLEKPRAPSPELPPQPPSLNRRSPEGIIAAARARAAGQIKPAVRNLNSLPIPIIVPTAYSASYMEEEETRLLSSPPPSSGSGEAVRLKDGGGSGTRTPTKERGLVPKTPMQLSSPPGSDAERSPMKDGHRPLFGGLTSSVVKGEAANGLLELMRATA